MPRLWRAPDNRFFLVPDDAAIPAGDLDVQDLTGHVHRVDEAAIAAFRVDEDTAREHAVATMAAIRENAKAGVRALGDAMKEAVGRTADLAEAAAAIRHEARRAREKLELPQMPPAMQATLDEAAAQLRRLVDPAEAATAEGRAWLAEVAAKIAASGGPDWTADPASVPHRVREALGDPAFARKLGALVRELRDAAPVPRH